MSVLVGASFDSVVCLDIDDSVPWGLRTGAADGLAHHIGNRFHLGDCLIVLSGFGESYLNYHFIYDQRTRWPKIWEVIRKLAWEGILEDKLKSLKLSRGDFTVRLSRKTMDGFVPFPVGYVRCDYPVDLSERRPGGIVEYLTAWRIALSRNIRISNKSAYR